MSIARYIDCCLNRVPSAMHENESIAVSNEIPAKVHKQLEVFAKGAGKTSEPNVNTIKLALNMCGWESSIGSAPVNLYSGEDKYVSFHIYEMSPLLLDMVSDLRMKYGKRVGLSFDFGAKYLTISSADQKFLTELRENFPYTEVSTDAQEGIIQSNKIYDIETGNQWSSFMIDSPVINLPTLTVTSPSGNSVTIQIHNHEGIIRSQKMWTFFYKNGLQEAAKEVVNGGIKKKEYTQKEKEFLSRAGTCPVCERAVERRDDGMIMRHGWRQSVYEIAPPCFGWGYSPWEVSPQGAIDFLKNIETIYLPETKARLANLIKSPPDRYFNQNYKSYNWMNQAQKESRGIKEFFIRGVDDMWGYHYKRHIDEIENTISEYNKVIPEFKRRISSWKPTKFWHEEK